VTSGRRGAGAIVPTFGGASPCGYSPAVTGMPFAVHIIV
jgi:hypothetical protein